MPWGWEKALKEDKRRKEEEKRAQQAAQKAAREFDPSMVVKEKSKTGKIEDNKKKGAKVPPATGVNTNTAE